MKTNISALMNLISEEEKNINNIGYTINEYAINRKNVFDYLNSFFKSYSSYFDL